MQVDQSQVQRAQVAPVGLEAQFQEWRASLSTLIKLCLRGGCERGGRALSGDPGARSALSEVSPVSPEKSFYLSGPYHSLFH